ncbi:MAG: hypothetical protein ACI8RZ_005677 [Myxococcota bacterium]
MLTLLTLLTLSAQAAYPALSVPIDGDRVRLIIVGDTGALPVVAEEGAAWEGSHYNTAELRDQLRRSMGAEDADSIVAMGDLVYGPTFAQLSPKCRDTDTVAEEWLDPTLGDYFEGLPTTWLALGNHDVGHYRYSQKRLRCLRYYAATTDDIRLPEAAYTVDFGLAHLFVVDTNRAPSRWPSAEMKRRIDAEDGWVIMGGHHVLKTAFDKESEVEIRQWLSESATKPDLWINGHAHFLQFGVYDGIPALTSGAGSKVRVRPDCPGPECQGEEMPLFSKSTFGYAVVDLTAGTMTIRFKDAEGEALYCWEKTRDAPGAACAALEEPVAVESVPQVSVLGGFPMCEASAALTLPDGSVLVADNEVKDALFSFSYDNGLIGQERQAFADSKKERIEDIEALAGIDGVGVLMVGSHSRNKRCEPQSERRRLGVGEARVKTNDEEWAAMTASPEACRENLFGGAVGEDVGLLCAAIVAAEDAVAESAADCTGTLNIEGAMTDPDGRIWLGLRAPVVADRGAAMVRLSADFLAQDALSLDAVAWVTQPPQQAIRELHTDGEFFLGIAGSVADSGDNMTLWRAPMAMLTPGARQSVERIGLLPPSSEGLTRVGEDLVVVIDGDTPKDDAAACIEPAGQVRLLAAP